MHLLIKLARVLAPLLLIALASLATPALSVAAPRTASFDAAWRFHQGDAPGAEVAAFDDAAWATVDVPHDWAIAGPFDRDAPTGRGGAYLPSGVSWYRKQFTLPAGDAGRRVAIEFDGVMSHSTVWINGHELGHRPSGYATFRYDLTPHLKFGDDVKNVLAVRADTSRQPASRWYAGAGIHRHVRLTSTEPLHLAPWGVSVTTPEISNNQASVRVTAEVVNEGAESAAAHVRFAVYVTDPPQNVVEVEQSIQLPAGEKRAVQQTLTLPNTKRWSTKTPNLYLAVVAVRHHQQPGSEVSDAQAARFGVREFRFDAETGFWLNGENMKIKGVCLHHDGGAVGSAVPKAVWRRRLQTLKSLGVNAIRTAHNVAAPEFLDLCDELGLLVMHEVFDCWTAGKNNAQNGYNRDFRQWWERDLRDAIVRDRNHPSIILYSAGNEIRDNLRAPAGFDQFKAIKAIYDELDGTRPVTMAIFRPNQSGVYDTGFAELMDVVGQNYREQELVDAHLDKPTRRILGTENGQDRRVWLMMRDNPFYSGQFLWTGIEYLGENDWPYNTWADAPVDRAGFVKPLGLERRSWWSDEPMVAVVRDEAASGGASGRGRDELVDHWTPRDADTYDEARVQVYSNCDEVELVLNGRSVGKAPMPADDSPAQFRLAYEPGTLEAIGRNDGAEAARQTLKSADFPAALRLTADQDSCSPNFDDIVHVEVEVVDAAGVPCPWAEPMIEFAIEGPGKLIAVDNADPQSHESFVEPRRRAYHGRALAILRPTADTGRVTLRATAPNLDPAEVTITAKK